MGRTWLTQDNQINASLTYNQTLAAGSALQTSAVSIEDDFNALRSQISKILDATGVSNWYDAVNTTNAKQRSIKQLNVGLNTIETKTLLARSAVATTISVPAGQNYVVLSVSGAQTPSPAIAIANTTLGTVVAQSATNASAFAANELTAVSGTDTLNPKNLCLVRNASTGITVQQANGLDVYALIQVESTAVDGGAFNDTSGGNRVKLSFIVRDPSSNTISAATTASVGGLNIQYSYVLRQSLSAMPEQYFIGNSSFTDQIATADVTLQNAFTNQGGAAVTQSLSQQIQIANAQTFTLANAGATKTMMTTTGAASGSTAVAFAPDSLSFNVANTMTSTNGIVYGSGGTAPTRINVVSGQLDNLGSTDNFHINALAFNLFLQSNANVRLLPTNQIQMSDVQKNTAGWTATVIPLSSTTAAWVSWKANFGEVGILDGVVASYAHGNHSTRWANVTAASIPANTNVTGAGASPNIDTQLFDTTGTSFLTQVHVYVNGQLMRPGTNAAAGNDVWPGTTPASGDLMFAFPLIGTASHRDVITMSIFQSSAYPI